MLKKISNILSFTAGAVFSYVLLSYQNFDGDPAREHTVGDDAYVGGKEKSVQLTNHSYSGSANLTQNDYDQYSGKTFIKEQGDKRVDKEEGDIARDNKTKFEVEADQEILEADFATIIEAIPGANDNTLNKIRTSLKSVVSEGNRTYISELKNHLYTSTETQSKIIALEVFSATEITDIPEPLREELLEAIRANVEGNDEVSRKALETLSFLTEGDAHTQEMILSSYAQAQNVEESGAILDLLASVRDPLPETKDLLKRISEAEYENFNLRSSAAYLLESWQE